MAKKFVYGVGINDADYCVTKINGNGRSVCEIYMKWADMMKRCYSKKELLRRPSYLGCSVCSEWLLFSNFKKWIAGKEYKGKHLDKDLIVNGNKIYSPETCCLVDPNVNGFILDNHGMRGKYMIGVSWNNSNSGFHAQCSNWITGKREHLGYFRTETEAHAAWRKRKHELACQLADSQKDDRIAAALRTRYL